MSEPADHVEAAHDGCAASYLIGVAVELAYVIKAIGETNKRTSLLPKHIKPE